MEKYGYEKTQKGNTKEYEPISKTKKSTKQKGIKNRKRRLNFCIAQHTFQGMTRQFDMFGRKKS